ncbi:MULTISPECIES: WXG100 family type VII secretion target [unclassified Nocardia]|uniref:WXG100 family type VII secretion target n=1 Tax=unclassified Nocardia TaxID=2637762 RepID=UPI001CE49535|nr:MULTISPECIES: WXG100 family type VII secretion target [unclassified Nocardia]
MTAPEFALVPESASSASDYLVATAQSLADGFRTADTEVQELMSTWQGRAADSYATGWREVHRGATTVFDALKELAEAIGATAQAVSAIDVQRARAQASYTSSLDLP